MVLRRRACRLRGYSRLSRQAIPRERRVPATPVPPYNTRRCLCDHRVRIPAWSGKIHAYFATATLNELENRAGSRANLPYELVVSTDKASSLIETRSETVSAWSSALRRCMSRLYSAVRMTFFLSSISWRDCSLDNRACCWTFWVSSSPKSLPSISSLSPSAACALSASIVCSRFKAGSGTSPDSVVAGSSAATWPKGFHGLCGALNCGLKSCEAWETIDLF